MTCVYVQVWSDINAQKQVMTGNEIVGVVVVICLLLSALVFMIIIYFDRESGQTVGSCNLDSVTLAQTVKLFPGQSVDIAAPGIGEKISVPGGHAVFKPVGIFDHTITRPTGNTSGVQQFISGYDTGTIIVDSLTVSESIDRWGTYILRYNASSSIWTLVYIPFTLDRSGEMQMGVVEPIDEYSSTANSNLIYIDHSIVWLEGNRIVVAYASVTPQITFYNKIAQSWTSPKILNTPSSDVFSSFNAITDDMDEILVTVNWGTSNTITFYQSYNAGVTFSPGVVIASRTKSLSMSLSRDATNAHLMLVNEKNSEIQVYIGTFPGPQIQWKSGATVSSTGLSDFFTATIVDTDNLIMAQVMNMKSPVTIEVTRRDIYTLVVESKVEVTIPDSYSNGLSTRPYDLFVEDDQVVISFGTTVINPGDSARISSRSAVTGTIYCSYPTLTTDVPDVQILSNHVVNDADVLQYRLFSRMTRSDTGVIVATIGTTMYNYRNVPGKLIDIANISLKSINMGPDVLFTSEQFRTISS
jgi:hypothetical protein